MLGTAITRARHERRLTQRDLAKLIGSSRMAVCQYERCRIGSRHFFPAPVVMDRLAAVLNLDVTTLQYYAMIDRARVEFGDDFVQRVQDRRDLKLTI